MIYLPASADCIVQGSVYARDRPGEITICDAPVQVVGVAVQGIASVHPAETLPEIENRVFEGEEYQREQCIA